ncbi:hypothetical protein WIS52_01110 [Pseudonocardia nematodicida]|uniref:Sigma-70 family RNA polymerase sigma factor n=1 Tax=Pseudonocardia nematodicida TaxID=1206997 RepID=A0ABV1K3M1_9PSEU
MTGPDQRMALLAFRRLADAEVVDALRAERCAGWRWQVVRAREAENALRRLRWLVRSEHLPARTRALGRPVYLDPEERRRIARDDERDVVVGDAVAVGIEVFRRRGVLAPPDRGGWCPDQASLSTFATNACVMHLSASVARWRRASRVPRSETPVEPGLLPEPEIPPSPEVVAFEKALAADPALAALVDAKEGLRAALALRYDTGAAWSEIAAEVGIPPDTLRGRRAQLQREVRRLFDARRLLEARGTDPDGIAG